MKLRVSHYPNNEIRVTLTGENRRAVEDETHETHPFFMGHSLDESVYEDTKPPRESPLDITSDFQECLKPLKSGFGGLPRKTVFGLNAKRTIQRVGGVCDRLYKNEEFVFLTGTLPGSTPEAVETIARWSGFLVESLKNWVAYYVQERIDFYVWEWQKRGALHLHYAVHVPDPARRKLVINRFKEQWIRLLEAVCCKSGVDVFARQSGGTWRHLTGAVQAYAQPVRKSVAAYLAKYCSKGHKTELARFYPSRWWGCSRALLHKLEEMTVSFEIVSLNMRKALVLYEELLHLNQSLTIKDYSYRHGSGMGKTNVGFHHPTIALEEIRQCIMTKLSELSRGFSAVMSKSKSSQEHKPSISYLLPYLHLYVPLASAPLKEKLQELERTSSPTVVFSTSDLRELYAITSDFFNRPSCRLNVKRMKNDLLRDLRLSELRERYVREEDGRYVDGVSVQPTW